MGNHRLMKRITFLIGSLGGGGAERVTVLYSNDITPNSFKS